MSFRIFWITILINISGTHQAESSFAFIDSLTLNVRDAKEISKKAPLPCIGSRVFSAMFQSLSLSLIGSIRMMKDFTKNFLKKNSPS